MPLHRIRPELGSLSYTVYADTLIISLEAMVCARKEVLRITASAATSLSSAILTVAHSSAFTMNEISAGTSSAVVCGKVVAGKVVAGKVVAGKEVKGTNVPNVNGGVVVVMDVGAVLDTVLVVVVEVWVVVVVPVPVIVVTVVVDVPVPVCVVTVVVVVVVPVPVVVVVPVPVRVVTVIVMAVVIVVPVDVEGGNVVTGKMVPNTTGSVVEDEEVLLGMDVVGVTVVVGTSSRHIASIAYGV